MASPELPRTALLRVLEGVIARAQIDENQNSKSYR
jgi:hypothetical protein